MGTTLDTRVIVIINDRPFAGWTSARATQSMDMAVGDAQVMFSAQPGNPLPIKRGDKAQVLFAGQPVVTGFVRKLSGQHDIKHHPITAQIRCKTGDLVQSTVGPKLDIDPPCTLADVCRKTLGVMGIKGVGVIDRLNADPYGPGEKVSSPIDMRGHEFLERWAAKRFGLLTTDGKGNLVLDRNQGRRSASVLHFGLPDDPFNNVESSSFSVDDFDRFNAHAVAGQKSSNHKSHWEGRPKGDPQAQAKTVSNRFGVAHDPSVRQSLRKHSRGGDGMQGKTPKGAAGWKSNTARAKSNEYVAVVPGFCQPNGQLWWPGFIHPVYDYWWELDTELLLKSVAWTKNWPKGAQSILTFTLKDGFTDQASAGKGGKGKSLPGEPGETEGKASASDLGIDDAEVDSD